MRLKVGIFQHCVSAVTRKKVLSVFYDPWKFNFIQHQSTYGNFFKPLVSYKISVRFLISFLWGVQYCWKTFVNGKIGRWRFNLRFPLRCHSSFDNRDTRNGLLCQSCFANFFVHNIIIIIHFSVGFNAQI